MLLEVRDLHVVVGGKPVLDGVNLSVDYGETVLLLGPNGSGKTSLLQAIMGNPKYEVVKGSIIFRGRDVTDLPVEERVRLGLALSFQFTPKIRGLTVRELLEEICEKRRFSSNDIQLLVSALNVKHLLDRSLNVGFSGGEMKKVELLLLLAQKPLLALLDEPDSGVDVENIAVLGRVLNYYLNGSYGDFESSLPSRPSALIVTHLGYIARFLNASRAYVVIDGKIVCHGKAEDVVDVILKHGFEKCIACYRGRALQC
mgnify:CR=1 FL=1